MEKIVDLSFEDYYTLLGRIFVLNTTNEEASKGVLSTLAKYKEWCEEYEWSVPDWKNYGQCYLEMAELRDDYYAAHNKYKLPYEFHKSVTNSFDKIYRIGALSLYHLYESFCQRYRIEPVGKRMWAKLCGVSWRALNETSQEEGDIDE